MSGRNEKGGRLTLEMNSIGRSQLTGRLLAALLSDSCAESCSASRNVLIYTRRPSSPLPVASFSELLLFFSSRSLKKSPKRIDQDNLLDPSGDL
jgi:hypothetical protein